MILLTMLRIVRHLPMNIPECTRTQQLQHFPLCTAHRAHVHVNDRTRSKNKLQTSVQVEMHVKVGFDIRLRRRQWLQILQALISPRHTAQTVRHVKTSHCMHAKMTHSRSDSLLWMHANHVECSRQDASAIKACSTHPSTHNTCMHVTASLDIPKSILTRLTPRIFQRHTAHADQRHARQRPGVSCRMQSSMHESTCTRGRDLGGLAEAIIQT
jgi:hypothetical protein